MQQPILILLFIENIQSSQSCVVGILASFCAQEIYNFCLVFTFLKSFSQQVALIILHKQSSLYLIVSSLCVCTHTCHGTHVEIRGQLSESFLSFYFYVGFQGLISDPQICTASTFICQVILPGPIAWIPTCKCKLMNT